MKKLLKIPVDIVLSPEWWYTHEGITFDRDFFFHPLKRVEMEQKMEQVLYDRWGNYGLGAERNSTRPEIGAVHLAAGFMLSEMLGCIVNYSDSHPPQVQCANRHDLLLDPEEAFQSAVFHDFMHLCESLESQFGYLTGDVNWGGVLNIAMDLRGQQIFVDMAMEDPKVQNFFDSIFAVLQRFLGLIERMTGSSSLSVNRVLQHLKPAVLLHSECSHTMISTDDYQRYLKKYDAEWAQSRRPFGIHYCGNDPHRFAEQFAGLPALDFLDLGWGGDVALLRKYLPQTFLNIRMSPVELVKRSPDEIREAALKLLNQSAIPHLTGLCCINLDDQVSDAQIAALFEAAIEFSSQ